MDLCQRGPCHRCPVRGDSRPARDIRYPCLVTSSIRELVTNEQWLAHNVSQSHPNHLRASSRLTIIRRMPLHSSDMLTLAKHGARVRIKELLSELSALKKTFRHLRYGSAVSPSMPDAAEEG